MDRPGRLLTNLPREVRLALEMATHEESERRALEGELSLLTDAWQEAEEIAAIADDLFVSDETRRDLEADAASRDCSATDLARRFAQSPNSRSSLGVVPMTAAPSPARQARTDVAPPRRPAPPRRRGRANSC